VLIAATDKSQTGVQMKITVKQLKGLIKEAIMDVQESYFDEDQKQEITRLAAEFVENYANSGKIDYLRKFVKDIENIEQSNFEDLAGAGHKKYRF